MDETVASLWNDVPEQFCSEVIEDYDLCHVSTRSGPPHQKSCEGAAEATEQHYRGAGAPVLAVYPSAGFARNPSAYAPRVAAMLVDLENQERTACKHWSTSTRERS
jgi:hypothetical protein